MQHLFSYSINSDSIFTIKYILKFQKFLRKNFFAFTVSKIFNLKIKSCLFRFFMFLSFFFFFDRPVRTSTRSQLKLTSIDNFTLQVFGKRVWTAMSIVREKLRKRRIDINKIKLSPPPTKRWK